MNCLLLSKLFPIIKLERALNTASFTLGILSFSMSLVKFKAPDFWTNSCTCLLSEVASDMIEQAIILTSGSGCEAISCMSFIIPPDKHRVKWFLGYCSTSSYNSVNREIVYSELWFGLSKILQIYCKRSTLLKEYWFMAASSHSRSAFEISLTSGVGIPSWSSIDLTNKPFQSTIKT